MKPKQGRSILFKFSRAAVCLLAGAVVTWAVAWGCALWVPMPMLSTTIETKDAEGAAFAVAAGMDLSGNHTHLFVDVERGANLGRKVECGSLLRWGDRTERGIGTGPRISTNWTRKWAGFPWMALESVQRSEQTSTDVVGLIPPRWLRAGNGPEATNWILPTRILPHGFTLDTLFYAGVVLGTLQLAGFARRRVRKNNSRCPACGYNRCGLVNHAPCPECGMASG